MHVLLAGTAFAVSLTGPDPAPHRAPFRLRATVLVLAVAAHGVLAKSFVAVPPPGVSQAAAELGAQIMYYGGAPLELALFVLLGREWLAVRRRRFARDPDGAGRQPARRNRTVPSSRRPRRIRTESSR